MNLDVREVVRTYEKKNILKYFHESKSVKHPFVLCEDFDILI